MNDFPCEKKEAWEFSVHSHPKHVALTSSLLGRAKVEPPPAMCIQHKMYLKYYTHNVQ